MDTLFSIVMYILFGFFGFVLLLFVLALLFGKRKSTNWEYEAEFRDATGRKFGELDIEESRVEKEEADFTFKARFKMRHDALEAGQDVQVYLDDLLIMQGIAGPPGRVYLPNDAIVNAASDPKEGQNCRVIWGGVERFTAPIRPD